MKLYAVLWGAEYEGDSLIAIFSTKEKADAVAKKLNTDDSWGEHRVEEYTLDHEPETVE